MPERENEIICTGDPRRVLIVASEPVKIAPVSPFDSLLTPSSETIEQIEQEYA